MHNKLFLSSFLSLTLASSTSLVQASFAQIVEHPTTDGSVAVLPTHDAKAIEVATASLQRMGVVSAVGSNTISEGTITMWDGKTGPITAKSIGSDHVRYEFSLSGDAPFVFAASSGNGLATKAGKKSALPTWITQYAGPEHIPAFSRLNDFSKSDMNVIYVGEEKNGDSSVHHIKIFKSDTDPEIAKIEEKLSEFHVFIDTTSLLVVKIQSNIFSPETASNSSVVENLYDDYRDVSGVLVPFHIMRHIAGQQQSEIKFDTVSLQAGNTEADFQ